MNFSDVSRLEDIIVYCGIEPGLKNGTPTEEILSEIFYAKKQKNKILRAENEVKIWKTVGGRENEKIFNGDDVGVDYVLL